MGRGKVELKRIQKYQHQLRLRNYQEFRSMEKTIEKYHRCRLAAQMMNDPNQIQVTEYKSDIFHEGLFDVREMSVKELEQLEKKLDRTLKQVRSTKTQSMLKHLDELHKMEDSLLDTNKDLKERLEKMNSDHVDESSFYPPQDQSHQFQTGLRLSSTRDPPNLSTTAPKFIPWML